MKSKLYYSILILGFITFIFSTAFLNSPGDENIPANKGLIKFSHSFHISNGAECGDCHTAVSESTSLDDRLLPSMEECAGCHDVEDEDNCETCHYEDVYESLVQHKSQVVFNHKFHLSQPDVDCENCHEGISSVDYSWDLEHPSPKMDNCYTCHNNISAAPNACETCHISTVALIPETHKQVSFLKNHKFTSEEADANCAMCHDNSFCESCHIATNRIGVANTERDFYTPYSPHNFIDNAKQQKITRVHGLNFRYTHGIEAKGKTAECATCHETETFCAECHNSQGGDFALGGIKPLSHSDPNFKTFGVGSGGGEHAVLAKRDIEQCAACHDVQGADPTCILCHIDNDGIKGTNPKTHEINFMIDNEGNWHSDDGSVCYSCHTSSNASTGIAGVGFCGYCHGQQ